MRPTVLRGIMPETMEHWDITALHLAIYKHAGLVTFHGPVASSTLTDYAIEHMMAVLSSPQPTYTIPMALENSRRALETGAEDRVQALALQGEEGDDALVGSRAYQHGEDREQQQMVHTVAPSLRTTRVVHLGERGKQASKRHRGDLHEAARSLP